MPESFPLVVAERWALLLLLLLLLKLLLHPLQVLEALLRGWWWVAWMLPLLVLGTTTGSLLALLMRGVDVRVRRWWSLWYRSRV